MDRDEILRVLRAFEVAGVEYILIGAAAMGLHGIVRATEDLDVIIAATAENVERLREAFRRVYGNDPHIEEISATDLLGEYPAVRYYPPSGDLVLRYPDASRRGGGVRDGGGRGQGCRRDSCEDGHTRRAVTVSRKAPSVLSITRIRRPCVNVPDCRRAASAQPADEILEMMERANANRPPSRYGGQPSRGLPTVAHV